MQSKKLKEFSNELGSLFPIEFVDLPFKPVRIFWTVKVPKGSVRGNHAHYKTKQLLICIQGKIEVNLYDGINYHKHVINPGETVFVDNFIWDSQKYLTGDDILIVLCSTNYDENDYILTISDFLEEVNKNG